MTSDCDIFPSQLLSGDLAYILFSSSTESGRTNRAPHCLSPLGGRDALSIQSLTTPFPFSWKDTSLNFEGESETCKYRLSVTGEVFSEGLTVSLHRIEDKRD